MYLGPLITIPSICSRTCSEGIETDADEVVRTLYQRCCVWEGERRTRGVGTHPSLWFYIICPLRWSQLIESINLPQPETEEFSETGICPLELMWLTFVRMCVSVSQLVALVLFFTIDWGMKYRMFTPVGPSWVYKYHGILFKSQAVGMWAGSSSPDGLDMNSDILIYYLQKEITAAGRSIIQFCCLYHVPQQKGDSYKNKHISAFWYLLHCRCILSWIILGGVTDHTVPVGGGVLVIVSAGVYPWFEFKPAATKVW